ncbi:putative peptidyl-prolyl cis-trans isomerase [Pilimelia terevasa]|uniref:Putative peptidyl-prolyl cis-trans isomerase n=1 Tax=Pilimelia terevasa TaxID=53372 RepID=A0A8J3BMN8_9ACTN|nr:peptidylprolyl isomerase [Pilimelia terevasa]GGK25465.1 putative peptidyl-prolyl cis-trans isomerase [Pilimelia terevasa]
MNATNQPERAAARARLEKDMADRRAAARRRRRTQSWVAGGAAIAAVVGGTAWVIYKVTYVPPPPTSKACTWLDAEPGAPGTVKDVGKPPATVSMVGSKTVTFSTNFGDIRAVMDLTKSPCTAASLAYLAEKGFFTGTKCHRMIPAVLQCGDPGAKGKGYRQTDGQGGPSYRFDTEYLPTSAAEPYPAGTLAMARRSDSTQTNGSQFFFTYENFKLPPEYTVFGQLDPASIEVVKKATKAGDDKAYEKIGQSGGHPKAEIVFQSVIVK